MVYPYSAPLLLDFYGSCFSFMTLVPLSVESEILIPPLFFSAKQCPLFGKPFAATLLAGGAAPIVRVYFFSS